MNPNQRLPVCLCLVLLAGIRLSAHHSWIVSSPAENRLEIGHGHSFPISEQAMNPEHIRVSLFTTDGTVFPAAASRNGKCLTVTLPPECKQLGGAMFCENPLILNRTPQGIKTGPMGEHPGVADSFRRHRSGIFLGAPGLTIAAAADHILLSCSTEGAAVVLQCQIGDRPLAGAELTVCDPDNHSERELGRSDAHGRLRFSPIRPGLHLFTASWTQASTSPDTQREEYLSTLVIPLR